MKPALAAAAFAAKPKGCSVLPGIETFTYRVILTDIIITRVKFYVCFHMGIFRPTTLKELYRIRRYGSCLMFFWKILESNRYKLTGV
jgi:hypothetical protein